MLEGSSKEIIEIGEIGQATTIKIATNMVTAATVQVAAEALALVESSGLAPSKFVEAMRCNASNSPTLAMKLPKMIEGDFEPHFSVKHMLKDMQIAIRLARASGLSLGATEAAQSSLLEEARQNRGEYDYTSLVHAFFPEGSVPEATIETAAQQHPTLGLEEAAPPEVVAEQYDSAVEPGLEELVPMNMTEFASFDETAAELEVNDEPADEESAAEETKPEVTATEEDGRRGFFSRMFSKTTGDRGADY